MLKSTKCLGVLLKLLCSLWFSTPALAEEPFLATDLTFMESDDYKELSFEIDPWLAWYPKIAPAIRRESLEFVTSQECPRSTPIRCIVNTEWTMHFGDDRVLSVTYTRTAFLAGMLHPVSYAFDRTYDLRTGQEIRFGDLFTSWPDAREILQAQWCEVMSKRSMCPPIENQALALFGDSFGARRIFVQTSDYAFGSYVEGSDSALLAVTAELEGLIKSEYRSSFGLSER